MAPFTRLTAFATSFEARWNYAGRRIPLSAMARGLLILGMSLPPPRKSPEEEINRLHGEINTAALTALQKAVRIGELLIQEKARLGRNNWLPWLEANVRFSQKTANNYMRVFVIRDKLEAGSNLKQALKLLPRRLKPRIKGDPKVRTPGTTQTVDKRKRYEKEVEIILTHISTVEGNLRSARGFDDAYWRSVKLDEALGLLKKVRGLLRPNLPPPPKRKPA
jgi:Protein of unknown function (DUF3102)